MDSPQSLDTRFKQKLFRIPDYQRGYAWQEDQLRAFWDDLVSLPDARSHYTGVLTLKALPADTIRPDANEFWLVDDHDYKVHDIRFREEDRESLLFLPLSSPPASSPPSPHVPTH